MSEFGEGYRGAGSARRVPDPGTSVFLFFFLVFVYQQDSVFLYNKRHIEYTRVLRGAHALVMRKSVRNFVCDFRCPVMFDV